MSKKSLIIAAAGSAFVAGLATAPIASAAENPFALTGLSSGYQLADSSKSKEGKCGAKKATEAKAAEGKCGAEKKAAETAEMKADDKKMPEGKCGEGKCGAAKTTGDTKK